MNNHLINKEQKRECPDCQKAKLNPDWAGYHRSCRECTKRQLASMHTPRRASMTAANAWIGKKANQRWDKRPGLPINTLEQRILDELMQAWGNRILAVGNRSEFTAPDFEKLDVEMRKLADSDYGVCTALIAKYKRSYPEKYSTKTQEHSDNLIKGRDHLLVELREVIQKYIWKKLEKK